MNLKRRLFNDLSRWARSGDRRPLLLRGARQVGKTWAVEEWCRLESRKLVAINFEEQPQFARLFEADLNVQRIVDETSLAFDASFASPGTVLFFDEIQKAPKALTALRYFYEKRPDIVIVAAGSLVEFVLEEAGLPVGRVQSKFVYPLSFVEFLGAVGKPGLARAIEGFDIDSPESFSDVIHGELLSALRLYFQVGGMPKVIRAYLENRELRAAANEQSILVRGYVDDFRKYAKTADWDLLEIIFQKMGVIAGGAAVKFSTIDSHAKSVQVRRALLALEKALIVHKIRPTQAKALPLAVHAKDKNFKLAFLDIGLLHHLVGFDWTKLDPTDLTDVADGRFAEQFVAQEIITARSDVDHYRLHHWSRDQPGSEAEVDFVVEHNNRPAPVEVKSGKRGRLRSLDLYLQETKAPVGYVLSQRNVERLDNVTFLPLYLAGRL